MMKRISERKDPYFSVFLRQVREESDVLAEDLVEGVMDISQLSQYGLLGSILSVLTQMRRLSLIHI